jgi:hypothetical protein
LEISFFVGNRTKCSLDYKIIRDYVSVYLFDLLPNTVNVKVLCLCVWFVDRCLTFYPFSFGHCVVCSSLIYGFWLPPFGILKLFVDILGNVIFLIWILDEIFNILRRLGSGHVYVSRFPMYDFPIGFFNFSDSGICALILA